MVKKILALSLGVALVIVAIAFAFAGKGDRVSVSSNVGDPITTPQELGAALGTLNRQDGETASVTVHSDVQVERKYSYDENDAQSGTNYWSNVLSIYVVGQDAYARSQFKNVQKHEQGNTSSSSMIKFEAELFQHEGKSYVRFLSFVYTGDVTDPDLEEGETLPELTLLKQYAQSVNGSLNKWISLEEEETLNAEQTEAKIYLTALLTSAFRTETLYEYGEMLRANTLPLEKTTEYDNDEGAAYHYDYQDRSCTAILHRDANAYFKYQQENEGETGSYWEMGSFTVSGWNATSLSYQVKSFVTFGDVLAQLGQQEEGGNE